MKASWGQLEPAPVFIQKFLEPDQQEHWVYAGNFLGFEMERVAFDKLKAPDVEQVRADSEMIFHKMA